MFFEASKLAIVFAVSELKITAGEVTVPVNVGEAIGDLSSKLVCNEVTSEIATEAQLALPSEVIDFKNFPTPSVLSCSQRA